MLYDLEADLQEARDLAAQHRDVVEAIATCAAQQHVPSPNWPVVLESESR